jgi:hypothetical protein
MADKKISALTGATTPLAGTEVLPIVQSGATVKVAVSDLTAGRAISTLSAELSPGSTDATTYVQATLKGGTATGNGIGYMKRQTTASVSTTTTDILGVGSFGVLVIVTGVGGGAIFSDLLMASYNGVAVISSNTQQGGPSARVYSTGSGFLKLTMVAGSAMAVIAQSIETGGTGA